MKIIFAFALAAYAAGCSSDLTGEESVALLIYASPRQLPADNQHIATIAAEAVKPGDDPPQDPYCVRLTVQLGTFDPRAPEPEPNADAGTQACPGPHCVFLRLPKGSVRRAFAVYHSTPTMANDVVLGDLYQIGEHDECPPATLPDPLATGFLTLGVPDVPPPPQDLSAAVSDMSAAVDALGDL